MTFIILLFVIVTLAFTCYLARSPVKADGLQLAVAYPVNAPDTTALFNSQSVDPQVIYIGDRAGRNGQYSIPITLLANVSIRYVELTSMDMNNRKFGYNLKLK